MYAKKSLGQHFLKSERALRTIVETAKIIPDELVLEIGPGQGALTERLLAANARVIAVEKDDFLYEELRMKFEKEIETGKLTLIHDDILNFEPRSYQLAPSTYKLVANIPYNITGAILEKFLSTETQPKQMVLLVQKEVAERIVGRCGHRVSTGVKESILSISVKTYGNPLYIEKVLAGSFAPAPTVDSAIISVENISKNFFLCGHSVSTEEGGGFTEEAFFKLVKAGFASKRKKLSSNLSNIYPKEAVLNAFSELNLSENTRAEEVRVEIWQKLALSLTKIEVSG